MPARRQLLKAAVESKGIEVVLEAQTAAIEGNGKAERVVLKDGRSFPADLVVMAAGIRPETALAESGGIEIGRGIKVDDKLETNWPGVYAIGECAEHRGTCYGIVEPVYEQAKALARYLVGPPRALRGLADGDEPQGVRRARLFHGRLRGRRAPKPSCWKTRAPATYRKLVVRDNRLAGVVLFGDTSDAFWYRDLIGQALPLSRFRPLLAFGKAHAEAA